jgi:hypothetical protein
MDHLEDVGFEIEELERSKWGIVERVAARKRAAGLGGPAASWREVISSVSMT